MIQVAAAALGVVGLAWRSPYAKPAWHAFVVAGSALQFAAVALYVLPHHAMATQP